MMQKIFFISGSSLFIETEVNKINDFIGKKGKILNVITSKSSNGNRGDWMIVTELPDRPDELKI